MDEEKIEMMMARSHARRKSRWGEVRDERDEKQQMMDEDGEC